MDAQVVLRASEVTVIVAALALSAVVVWHTATRGTDPRRWVATGAVVALCLVMVTPGSSSLWFAVFPLVLATYPDGRFTPRWMVAPVLASAALTAGLVVSGGALSDTSWWPWFAMSQVLLLAGPVHRYRRRASTRERESARWVLLGTLLTVAGYAATEAAFGTIGVGGVGSRVAADLAILPVLVALVVGMVAPGILDVDRALHAATTVLLTVGVLSLLALGLPGEPWVTLVAVAVAGAPVALGALRVADRLVYRGRPSPGRAVARMLAALNAPENHGATPRVVLEAVVGAAFLDGGRIDGTWFPAVEVGRPGSTRVSIEYRGETIAVLGLAPRRSESALTRRDRRVVEALVAQAAPALDGARTLLALHESRARVVTAREEERRRLRRELHDDLGPTLSGIALSAYALATTTRSPDAHRLHDEIREAVTRSRALAYGLRPPVLDDHGLVAALSEVVGGDDVEVTAPDGLDLSAAVDLAALRIVQEAVGNARRHAPGSSVRVVLLTGADRLHVEVRDDGPGLPADVRAGVGMHSIAERADELGGSAAYDRTGPGCVLRVTLPLETP